MSKSKSLLQANPYLRDPQAREDAVVKFVHGVNKLEGLSVPQEKTREHYRIAAAKPVIPSKSKLLKDR